MQLTITKTVQVRQYEPLTVTVTDSMTVETKEDRAELYRKVSSMCEQVLAKEYARYDELGAPLANSAKPNSASAPSTPKLRKPAKKTTVVKY